MFGAVKKLISVQVQEHGCGTRVSSADRQAGLLVGQWDAQSIWIESKAYRDRPQNKLIPHDPVPWLYCILSLFWIRLEPIYPDKEIVSRAAGPLSYRFTFEHSF